MASGTSAALPSPTPTCPARSPTTTRARMLKRRPPLTTLETRATWTTLSSRFSFEASILAIFLPFKTALEIQADFTSAFCKGSDPPMVGIATAIKDDAADALLFGPLGNEFAHLSRNCYFAVVSDCSEGLNRCSGDTFFSGWEQSFHLGSRLTSLTRGALLLLSTLGLGLGSNLFHPGSFPFGRGDLGCHLYRSFFCHGSFGPCSRISLRGDLKAAQSFFE